MPNQPKTVQDLSKQLDEMSPLEAWEVLKDWLTATEKYAFISRLMSVYTAEMLLNLKAVEAVGAKTAASVVIRQAIKDASELDKDDVAECLEELSKSIDGLLGVTNKRRQVRMVSAILQAIADFLSACEKDEESLLVGTVLDDIYSELKHLKGVTF